MKKTNRSLTLKRTTISTLAAARGAALPGSYYCGDGSYNYACSESCNTCFNAKNCFSWDCTAYCEG